MSDEVVRDQGMSRGLKIVLWVAGILVALALLAAFLMFGPPKLAEAFAEPEFCGTSCHEMEYVYTSFLEEEHAELETCNDCHLPNDGFIEHYAWEGVVGVRDLVKHGVGAVPENIEVKERSEEWLIENCHRCHDDEIDDDHGEGREFCWDCHDDVFHAVD
ncbi:MAG TPA: NapC/NirT family cytochrome c [Coriobacteriia bacterium]|nr:NapC/NirT family cytochrome c [Coriobacteriia bacterium]